MFGHSFRSLLKAFLVTTEPYKFRYKDGVNADLICDEAGALWTRDRGVPSLIQVTPPSVVEWQSHLVDTEIAFNFSNTIYQVVAFTETISQPWNNNPLYLLMAYTSFVSAGAVPFFSVPIPNPPDCVNITFAVPLYQRPLVTDAMYIAISSTPLTYTATPRLSQIQVAGGSGSVAPI